jgi:two-component system, OmpR family, alkaline phosphatase synthesis response regulator PhoP
MKVLVVEDDENIRNGLCEILGDEGYQAIAAPDGAKAMDAVRQHAPDLICLDIMMPGKNGYDVCRSLRSDGITTPIIFITAKSEEVDKVLGLELGADDFIVKPFGVREVVARIRAVTRRCLLPREGTSSEASFTLQDLTVHPSQLRATRNDSTIDLSLRDVKLLKLFYANPGKVLDRYTIFSNVWGLNHIPNSRTLDQHVAQLRKRIEQNPHQPKIIQTVHGVGYRYELNDMQNT